MALTLALLSLGACDGAKLGGRESERPAPEDRAPPESGPRAEAPPKKLAIKHAPRLPPAPSKDHGIYPEFNAKAEGKCPGWLQGGPFLRIAVAGSSRSFLAVDGHIVCEQPQGKSVPIAPLITLKKLPDQDDDSYPDSLDLLRGAKKTVLNGAHYKSSYRALSFPGGDVPRDEGVCTDVLIRSLRNAGFDLQELVARDIQERPGAYPMVNKADPHIDHRRVRTLLPYLQHAFLSLPTSPKDSAFPYFPGDIVLMNTMGSAEPEHLGIVSDTLGASGLPLIINNWTDGTQTAEMDLLEQIPVTHRFRAGQPLSIQEKDRGLEAFLKRRALSLPSTSLQAISVVAPLWRSSGGLLQLWRRSEDGRFHAVGKSIAVRLGAAGLGAGLGLHEPSALRVSKKLEGDKKAPAGVFALGTAFGRSQSAPYPGSWPYRQARSGDYWVDDPETAQYNTWQSLPPGAKRPWSAERLTMYTLGLVVEHNTQQPKAGAGSAIFLHPWKSPSSPTVGCTALDATELKRLLAWLSPEKHPALVQTAGRIF